MVLNGPTKTGKCPAIFENFNKNKKSLNPFIYKGFSDFLKSGADDGTRTRGLHLTKVVLYLLSHISISPKWANFIKFFSLF